MEEGRHWQECELYMRIGKMLLEVAGNIGTTTEGKIMRSGWRVAMRNLETLLRLQAVPMLYYGLRVTTRREKGVARDLSANRLAAHV